MLIRACRPRPSFSQSQTTFWSLNLSSKYGGLRMDFLRMRRNGSTWSHGD